jgi:hypothetical protein
VPRSTETTARTGWTCERGTVDETRPVSTGGRDETCPVSTGRLSRAGCLWKGPSALGGQGGEGAGACACAEQGAARGHANLGTACLLTLSGGVEDSRARLASASLWSWQNEDQTGHDNQPHSQHDDETDLVSPLLRLEHLGYQAIHISHVVYCAGPRAGQLDRTAVAGR